MGERHDVVIPAVVQRQRGAGRAAVPRVLGYVPAVRAPVGHRQEQRARRRGIAQARQHPQQHRRAERVGHQGVAGRKRGDVPPDGLLPRRARHVLAGQARHVGGGAEGGGQRARDGEILAVAGGSVDEQKPHAGTVARHHRAAHRRGRPADDAGDPRVTGGSRVRAVRWLQSAAVTTKPQGPRRGARRVLATLAGVVLMLAVFVAGGLEPHEHATAEIDVNTAARRAQSDITQAADTPTAPKFRRALNSR